MIKFLERAVSFYEATLDIVCLGGGHILLFVTVLVVLAGQVRSCVVTPKESVSTPVQVVRLDLTQENHKRLSDALSRVADAFITNELNIAVVESKEINAASLGEGRFVLWEGLAELPNPALDAILAHEVAHDFLLHSRKVEDVADFTAFWTDLIGTVGQADFATSEVISAWGQGLVMPKYNREQEIEADATAVDLLESLGYERANDVFADALQLLLDRYGNTGGAFSDSHPATSERISAARTRSRTRGAPHNRSLKPPGVR
jgi:Zn-dependent protease with chaperone function